MKIIYLSGTVIVKLNNKDTNNNRLHSYICITLTRATTHEIPISPKPPSTIGTTLKKATSAQLRRPYRFFVSSKDTNLKPIRASIPTRVHPLLPAVPIVRKSSQVPHPPSCIFLVSPYLLRYSYFMNIPPQTVPLPKIIPTFIIQYSYSIMY